MGLPTLVLKINNSTSQVLGLSREQHSKLKALLSYKVDAQQTYFSQDYRGGVRALLAKDGSFPTGLLYAVKGWLRALPHASQDLRRRPKPSPGLYQPKWVHKPYIVQVEAARACKANDRGIVTAPTGCGKSIMAALIVQEMSLRTLIVVPSLELKRQLTSTLAGIFGETRVGGLGSTIAVENVQGLPLKSGDNLKTYKYDVLILDEFHHSAASTYRKLNARCWGHIYHRFGLTATPYRAKDEEKLLLESILAQVIYAVPYQGAVDGGYIVPMEAYYLEVPKTKIDSNNWHTVYKALVVENLPRNLQIAAILGNLKAADRSTLCLVREVAHGEALSKLTGLPFAHGQSDDSERLISQFSNGRIRSLIATEGVCGEGVDTRAAEYVIVAGLGKSRPALMQKCGRGFRRYPGKESCKVILFRDISHKYTLTHFRNQAKVISEEYGITVAKLE